jgi:hypothetical protein
VVRSTRTKATSPATVSAAAVTAAGLSQPWLSRPRSTTADRDRASLTHLVKALADWSLTHRPVIAGARHQCDLTHPDHDIR